MVVEVHFEKPFEYSPKRNQAKIEFASASSFDSPLLSVYLNDELVDKVCLTSPHSWWSATLQSIAGKDTLMPSDKLKVEVDKGTAYLRLDITER